MANVLKLLTIQGGKRFYCGRKLALAKATVEVQPKVHGGYNSDANAVACCAGIKVVGGHQLGRVADLPRQERIKWQTRSNRRSHIFSGAFSCHSVP